MSLTMISPHQISEPTAGGTPSPGAIRPTIPAGGSARFDFAAELSWRLADVEQRLDVISAWLYADQLDAAREALATAAATSGPDRGRTLDAAASYLAVVERALGLFADPETLAPGDRIRFSGRTVQVVRVTATTYESLVLEVSDGESNTRRACVSLRDPVRFVPSGGA